MARVAFIGLGHMGGGMAPNLAKAGHDVHAFDLSEEALARYDRALALMPGNVDAWSKPLQRWRSARTLSSLMGWQTVRML